MQLVEREVTKPLVVLAFRELGLSGGGTSTGGGRPGMLPFLLASIMAGAVASLVLVPMGLAALFVGGRILHAFGMDGWMPGRAIGIVVTLLVTVGLAGYAAAIPYLAFEESPTIELVDVAS